MFCRASVLPLGCSRQFEYPVTLKLCRFSAHGDGTRTWTAAWGTDFLFGRGPMFAKGGQAWGTPRLRVSASLEICPSVLRMGAESKSPP
jgi:hypothetical protein